MLVIYGPRRVGKTTLVSNFLPSFKGKYRFDNGDDIEIREILNSESIEKIKKYAFGYDLIIIDEAQRIPKIGLGLKILADNVKGIKIIATGSASFDLSQKLGEPLTGRQNILTLYPVSQLELSLDYPPFELERKKDEYIIYGSYPRVLTEENPEKKIKYLRSLVNSYLLKDILELEKVKGSKTLIDLLRLLAFQIGSEVSLNELARQLSIDVKTVARYLDLLEKAFVIYNLRGFSRNLRKEVSKKSKYYFYDNGIRNAIINNFNPLNLRDDVGKIWENFLVMERIKCQEYKSIFSNNYFWRTWDKKEIDFIEERGGKLWGYEFKWKEKIVKEPKDWKVNYPEASYEVINRENYLKFVCGE